MSEWTDERVAALKRMWKEGMSCSQIAAALGGVSRNAVIGKVHRLGLSKRVKVDTKGKPKAKRPSAASSRWNAPAVSPPVKPPPLPMPDLAKSADVVPLHGGVTLMDLTHRSCRWLLGDAADLEMRYCGCRTAEGDVYCDGHMAVAYTGRVPPPKRFDTLPVGATAGSAKASSEEPVRDLVDILSGEGRAA